MRKLLNWNFPKRVCGLPALCGMAMLLTHPARAEDWGTYSLVPVSAPALALEARAEGAAVFIGKPSEVAAQKWIIVPKEGDFCVIQSASAPGLVLSAAKGGTSNGTAITLEADRGEPWQLWALKKQESGSYNLIPKHAPTMGLDDLGGNQTPGTKMDLWSNTAGDEHLQWMIKPRAGSVALARDAPEAGTSYVPPDIQPEQILKGTLKRGTFNKSSIFPGTVREVTVFIPAQYDGSRPACVYVKTDGYNDQEKELLERLLATKEMPVTIGVFVRPGDTPSTVPGTLGRRNRCLEYDGVSDDNVRFLVDELLPFVAAEFQLQLSTSGNDRCIAGVSSGGIAAFNAAWQRPEAFSRVYAGSGSFVAFRGGHEFPTLVRKFEAKPIRAYLTTGTRDMENCAGDWFLLDQEMDKALKFSGYDYFFRIINGGHGAGFYNYYQEAMSFIWKGWPQPVQAGPSAPRARDILVPGEGWQLIAEGRNQPSAAASNTNGEVFFAEPAMNKIFRIEPDGQVREFVTDAGQANGLTFGADEQLYTVSSRTGKIMSYDSAGKSKQVMEGLRGQQILATPSGGFYVTSNANQAESSGEIWWVKDGQKKRVDAGLKFATGLAYRPDQWLLSVADGHSKWAYSYQINPDGTLAHRERFFWLHVPDEQDDAGAESMCYAREGQMFVATRLGIQVCADDGPTQVILPLPDHSRVQSLCFGGKEMDTLFAFSKEKIWKRKVKTHGVGISTPWTKVNGTSL